jgi:hypothetical protein
MGMIRWKRIEFDRNRIAEPACSHFTHCEWRSNGPSAKGHQRHRLIQAVFRDRDILVAASASSLRRTPPLAILNFWDCETSGRRSPIQISVRGNHDEFDRG